MAVYDKCGKLIKSGKNFAEDVPYDIKFDNGKVARKGTYFNVDYDRREQDEYVLGISVPGIGNTQLRFNSEDEASELGWINNSTNRKSGRFIKSGPGAGYDVTIEGIELDDRNYRIISDEVTNEKYNEHTTMVEVPVKPCVVEKWSAEAYYYGVDSEGLYVDGELVQEYFDDDKRVNGGKAVLRIIWYLGDYESAEEACDYVIPRDINITIMFGGGWSHTYLPDDKIHFEDDHGYSIDAEEVYSYETISVDLICPNISENINWYFKHDSELEEIFFGEEEDYVESSRKSIKSEMTSRQYQNAIDKAARMITEGERNVDLICKKTGLDRGDVESIIEEQEEMESAFSSRKPIKSSRLIKSNVEIDDDAFIEMLWDRVNIFTPAKGYDEEFWTECFDYLSDIGWMGDPWKNNPKYIVDNIAVNGEIFALEDCVDNYDEINDDYEGDVDAWIEDKGYLVFGDYVVINLGL